MAPVDRSQFDVFIIAAALQGNPFLANPGRECCRLAAGERPHVLPARPAVLDCAVNSGTRRPLRSRWLARVAGSQSAASGSRWNISTARRRRPSLAAARRISSSLGYQDSRGKRGKVAGWGGSGGAVDPFGGCTRRRPAIEHVYKHNTPRITFRALSYIDVLSVE